MKEARLEWFLWHSRDPKYLFKEITRIERLKGKGGETGLANEKASCSEHPLLIVSAAAAAAATGFQ